MKGVLLTHVKLFAAAGQNDHDGGKDEIRWKNFFMERKVGNFSDLTESEKTRLALSIQMPNMING